MTRTIKKLVFSLYAIAVVCMGAATVIEKYQGSEFVSAHIYGTWWFALVWALLAATATVYFVRNRTKSWTGITLHLSFLVILAGALLTHISAEQGIIHLRLGETTDRYTVYSDGTNASSENLPFQIRLNKFSIQYHPGTDAVEDYVSQFSITKDGQTVQGQVSMNRIFTCGDMRLYQASYDSDERGVSLATNSDPWGIPVTYTGYALLFLSLVLMLFDPRGAYRALLRSEHLRKGALLAVMAVATLFGNTTSAATASAADHTPHALPEATAEKFGELFILHNNRICPMQTFAIDFTKKLYGAQSYKGLTAEQVLTGWIFWGEEWMNEPIIKVKNGDLKQTLQLPDYVSAGFFFDKDMGGYTLGPYVKEYYEGNKDKFHIQASALDERIQLVMDLRRGTLLKIFPIKADNGKTAWYAPTADLPSSLDYKERSYIQYVFTLLYDYAEANRQDSICHTLDKMQALQLKNGGASIPSEKQTTAERTYNRIPFATILFILCLTMGVLSFLYTVTRICRQCRLESNHDPRATQRTRADIIVRRFSRLVMAVGFASLTYCEYLRWTISGTIPMANGYETMLFVAWTVMLLSLLLSFRFPIMLTCGFLMSGFFLLVSHISQMDPQITHVMPVLNSPLLSIHVSIIMMGFALLSLTFINAITALTVKLINRDATRQMTALQSLSLLFLYPAATTLGIGIFVGAIWANVSWGEYWGWDPKEVWALITFMVYAAALHPKTLPALRRPVTFHVFMLLAFLTILMTYFGVNYVLGGMHSYA